MAPLVRFPSNPVTPHGAWHILHDRVPMMGLTSFDETVAFHLMGGLAIPDFVNSPGRVEVKDLKGLVPPWRTIDQKGASQDGTTFVDALYDPIEVEITTRVKGANPADCRRVARYLMDSLDVKRQSRLWFFTHHLGYWWADIRWLKPPVDSVGGIRNKTQDLSLRVRADTGFWKSYPCVDEFSFSYNTDKDDFEAADDLTGPGTGWTASYSPAGTGVVRRRRGQLDPSLRAGRRAILRRNGYVAAANSVVSEYQLGTMGQWFGLATDCSVELWVRMNNTGTPGTSGVFIRLQRHRLRLISVKDGVETTLRDRPLIIPPQAGEKWKLIAGAEGNEKSFTILRGGAVMATYKETANANITPLGPTFRSAGLAFYSGSTSNAPAVRNWNIGVNATASQSGFLEMFNAGDQEAYNDYICYGPGLFKFWNGPGADPEEYVKFGPLLSNQVMYVRTDPRKRGVVDMTSIPATPQQLTGFQKALSSFLSFATGSNATPLAQEIKSFFGILPPQGNPYALLKGRWSRDAAIPPKSPGKPPDKFHVKVAIDDGNANSKIVSTLTPLRRMPW